MMNIYLNISSIVKQKIPSWKTDIGRNLVLLKHPIPRKTHISGHFHLKTIINLENNLGKRLIF